MLPGERKSLVMRVLIDTNVLIDFITVRKPYEEAARRIIDACDRRLLFGCVAAHSIPDIYYILRREIPAKERKEILKFLCEICTVEALDKYKIMNALDDEDFADFEDCLQMQCAAVLQTDYIITRNEADFKFSPIPSISPSEFCRHFLDG